MIPTFEQLFSDECRALAAGKSITICTIGAGGKTSTLFWLARAFYQQGRRVLLTTTTRMYLPPDDVYHQLIIDPQPTLRRADMPSVTALFSRRDAENSKVIGFPVLALDVLKNSGAFDVILVEADGAQRKWLKAPAGHEPCIPESSDCVIALTGGRVLNQPAVEQDVHRWEIFSSLTGAKAGQRLDCEVFSRFIGHPQGMFKGTPCAARRVWLLNQCYQNDKVLRNELTRLLHQHPRLSAIWLGAVQESPPVHTCLLRPTRHDGLF